MTTTARHQQASLTTRGACLLCGLIMVAAVIGPVMAEPAVSLRNGVRQHMDIPGKHVHQAGFGPDLFIFGPDNGHDQIIGFNPTEDTIQLRQVPDYPDYPTVARRVWSTPHGLFIGLTDIDSIRLAGTRPGDLTADNLIVAAD